MSVLHFGQDDGGQLIVRELTPRDLARTEPMDASCDEAGFGLGCHQEFGGAGVVDCAQRGAEGGDANRITGLESIV